MINHHLERNFPLSVAVAKDLHFFSSWKTLPILLGIWIAVYPVFVAMKNHFVVSGGIVNVPGLFSGSFDQENLFLAFLSETNRHLNHPSFPVSVAIDLGWNAASLEGIHVLDAVVGTRRCPFVFFSVEKRPNRASFWMGSLPFLPGINRDYHSAYVVAKR